MYDDPLDMYDKRCAECTAGSPAAERVRVRRQENLFDGVSKSWIKNLKKRSSRREKRRLSISTATLESIVRHFFHQRC